MNQPEDGRLNPDPDEDASDEASAARVFFCPEAGLKYQELGEADFLVHLCPEEARHAARVLRLQPDESVRLFDGEGWFYDAILLSVQRNHVSAQVLRRVASRTEARTRLTLIAALLRSHKLDLLIQKAVELGVAELRLFAARRGVSRWTGDSARTERGECRPRWDKIVIGACKQCGRAKRMPIFAYPSLSASLVDLPAEAARFVFWEDLAREGREPGRPTPFGVIPGVTRDIAAIIGPEGGFVDEEIELVREAGFEPRSLGPRILRAETAAIAASAILLREAGDI
jgi:16S rRNA (uracil1498-N3)-methyltransferase